MPPSQASDQSLSLSRVTLGEVAIDQEKKFYIGPDSRTQEKFGIHGDPCSDQASENEVDGGLGENFVLPMNIGDMLLEATLLVCGHRVDDT